MRWCRLRSVLPASLIFVVVAILPNLALAAPKFRDLYNFTGGTNGRAPAGALAFDANGNLFGTTLDDGIGTGCCGVVFELTPLKSGGWKDQVIYTFTGGSDGLYPVGGVMVDSAGNVYGTAANGGIGSCGTVYRLTPNGTTWTETTLYQFGNQPDGCAPESSLIMDSVGNLYGTTYTGGADSDGTVFQLVSQGNGIWTENVIHSFAGGIDGSTPFSGVTIDQTGNLYGTSSGGIYGGGTVFRLSPGKGHLGRIHTLLFYGWGQRQLSVGRSRARCRWKPLWYNAIWWQRQCWDRIQADTLQGVLEDFCDS